MNIVNLKLNKWYKNKKLWAGMAVVLGVAVWIFLSGGNNKTVYETITITRGDLVQEVSVTGKIKPAQAVDLQFENSGRIAAINYKVSDQVSAGSVIASLENQELQADVTSAKADLEKIKKNFESLNNPSVYSSLRVELENSQKNLDQTKIKTEGDLASDYNNAFNAMREAITQLDTSSVVLEYLRKTYLEAKDPWDEIIKEYQLAVKNRNNKVRNLFPAIDWPGTIITPVNYGQIDLSLQELSAACQSLRNAFTYLQGEVQDNSNLISSSTDRSSLNNEAVAISSDLSSISTAIQNIADQKITNAKNISDAEAKLATALASFPSQEDILQKEANLLSAQSKLRKSLIIAPFSGIIGKVDAEKGQTVNSSMVILSLISSAKYQIEANITEVDIGKIAVGNQAILTLDAYGFQTKLSAHVSTVDTAATIIDGVTTYKTIFDFNGEINPDIRPNMTANLDIQTAKKENVISVPQRSVISRDVDRVVRIFKGSGRPYEERIVNLGISGKDGYIEIINGLAEGEQVITFINE